jgi:uncharacterized membrane protein
MTTHNQQIEELGRAAGNAMQGGAPRDGEERGHAIAHGIMQQARTFPVRDAANRAQSIKPHTQRDRNAGKTWQQTNVAPTERMLSMAIGGALLAGALSNRSSRAAAMAIAGGALMHRGVTGHCYGYQAFGVDTAHSEESQRERTYATQVQRSMTINRPSEELHRFWREPQNLRRIMEHFATVTPTGEETAHWEMKLPIGRALQWDTRITHETMGQAIAWESLPQSTLRIDGLLEFRPATGGRGTVASLRMRFDPPAGVLGTLAAKAMRVVPSTIAMRALHRFKNLVETGEIATSAEDPSGRRAPHADAAQKRPVMGTALGLGWFSLGLGAVELFAPNALAKMIGVPAYTGLIRLCGLREIGAGLGLLSRRNPRMWMWSRVAGDAMDLSLLAGAMSSSEADRARVAGATAAVIGVSALDAWAATGFGAPSSSASEHRMSARAY